MDTEQFDRFVVALSRRTQRRSVLSLFTALGITGLMGGQVAAQTCLANGARCGRATDPTCCSGWCKRKHGSRKRFCKAAPDQGTCTIASNWCAATGSQPCDADGVSCLCYVSSRGYSVCARYPEDCYACETDADCEKRPGVGQPGDHCVQCADCAGAGTNNRACVRRCTHVATA
jgi:hypothetical protein